MNKLIIFDGYKPLITSIYLGQNCVDMHIMKMIEK
jgi:hypothetical protein